MAMDDLVPTDYDMDKDEVKDMKDNGGFVVDQRAKPLEAEKVTQEPNTKKGKKIKTPEGEIEVAAVESTDKPTKAKKEDKKYASKVKGNLKAFNEGGLAGKKSFPDLNDDGKITQADILKGRGVFYGGGLMDKEGYDEGGLLDDDGEYFNPMAIEDNAAMIKAYEESPEQVELKDLQERYAREENLTEEEVNKLFGSEKDEDDNTEVDIDESTGDIETVDLVDDSEIRKASEQDGPPSADDYAKALLKVAKSYKTTDDPYSAFFGGLKGGLEFGSGIKQVGNALAEKYPDTMGFLERGEGGFFKKQS